MGAPRVRAATRADGETLLALISGLADYEHLVAPDAEAGARIIADLGVRYDALLVDLDGVDVGAALFFETYSTFSGYPKLYLEDLFVVREARSTGAGFALFRAVAAEALRRNCVALEWGVLDWNRLALDFYDRLGGVHEKQWLAYRMEREVMERLVVNE